MSEHTGVEAFTAGLNYTMLVVTCRDHDVRAGCLVGFHTQTSIDPVRLLVCLSRNNVTTRVAARAEYLALHQLASADADLAELFGEHSAEETDKFAVCDWSDGPHGVPVLDRAAAWLVGRIASVSDGGDHAVFALDPVAAGRRCDSPSLSLADLPPLQPGQQA
jgi:flavin reductase (DIM6/NTAB) family NADH-FMN oxidoreductase RutF